MENSKPLICRATEKDIALLAEMGERTFRDAFGAENDPGDLEQYLASNFSREQIATEIADPKSTFLLIYGSDVPVGYAKLHDSEAPKSVQGSRPIELVRIYIDQSTIGKGHGAALMNACLEEASKAGFETIWLGVWERNARATAFYHKWGFEKVGTQNFTLGSDLQNDFVMERTL